MRRRSAASALLPEQNFDNGNWHRIEELKSFEALLLAARQGNKAYSDAVRVDTSPAEKLRRDELIPFLNLAEHLRLPDATVFRKPTRDEGVDIEYMAAGLPLARLQITTAYPVWVDAATGQPLNGGYQQRLHMEKLTKQGHLSGSGPFQRRGDHILNNDGCNSWEEIELSHRLGLIEAFKLKAARGGSGVVLLVRAVGYYQDILDVGRFHAMVEAAACVAFPERFSSVMVVDYGDGFIWSR